MKSWALCLFGLAGACADVDGYAAGVCGNNVLEPEVGEDCDLIPDDVLGNDLACGPPDGSAQQCRYICEGAECPRGWACEDDGICRPPSGRFEADEEPALLVGGQEIAVRNVDGDEAAELVVRLEGDVFVFGLEDDRFSEMFSLSLAAVRGELSFADVDGDELEDVLVPAASGVLDPAAVPAVHVLRSDAERLVSAIVPQQRLPERTVAATGVAITPGGPEVLLRATQDDDDRFSVVVREESCRQPGPAASLMLAEASAAAPLPPMLSGFPFATTAPVALVPNPNAAELFVVQLQRTCAPDACDPVSPVGVPCVTTLELAQTIELPGRVDPAGCVWIDADVDGDDDVLCNIEGDRLALAVNAADRFEPASIAEGLASDLAKLPQTQQRGCAPIARVLAAGDLDADGRDDLVTPHGVFLGGPDGFDRAFARVLGDAWGESVAGDFDRDGRLELVSTVLAADRGCASVRLESLRETQGAYNDVLIRDAAPPSTLRTGDFDGDGIDDVAAVEQASQGVRVSVFFGDTKEPLEDKVSLGSFATVDTIAAVRDRGGTSVNEDLVTDLAIVSGGGQWLTVATGTTSRSMLAPLRFAGQGETGQDRVVALAGRLVPGDDEQLRPPDLLTIAAGHAWLLRDDDVHHGRDPIDLGLDAFGLETGCSRWQVEAADAPALVVAVDGHQSAVSGLAQRCVSSGGSNVVVARVQGSRDAPRWASTASASAHGAHSPTSVHVFDFDDSGLPDVVVHFATTSQDGPGTVQWWRDPVVGGDSPPAALVSLAPEVEVWAATPINVDAQDDLELALLTPQGIRLLDFDAQGEPAVTLSMPVVSLPSVPDPDARRDLVAGDINADGIEDLVLVLGDGIWLLPAELRP